MMAGNWLDLLRIYQMARADAEEEVDSDDEVVLLGIAHSTAGWRLVTAGAPDLPALADQLQVFRDEGMFNLRDDLVCEILTGMIANLRRLSASLSIKEGPV